MEEISISGGGIAGLTTAIALNKAGKYPIVFESAAEIKAIGAGLGMGANAIKAFDHLGIKEEVVKQGRFLSSFTIYNQKGRLITKTNSATLSAKYGADNFTIHRAELHKLLLSKIDPQYIRTNKRVIDMEQNEKSVSLKFADGSFHETQFLIAADGIHSAIRKKLLTGTHPRYAGYTCWRAVIDNTDLNINETSETWGTAGRFGIVPLAGNKIYWFACINSPQNNPKMQNFTVSDLLGHFKDFHDPIPTLLEHTPDESLIWNDIIDLKPVSRFALDNVVLIGDAAHATTPNLGQGACQAIEDAVILSEEIKREPDISMAFQNFEKRRIKRTRFITENSWRIGKMAQIQNPLLASLRNFLFRRMPDSVNEKQMDKLFKVDF